MRMKRIAAAALLLVILAAAVAGCSGKRVSFDATVLENTGSALLVQPDEDTPESRSSDKISVSPGDARIKDSGGGSIELSDIREGDRVRIVHSGVLLETYPAQLAECYEIRLLD